MNPTCETQTEWTHPYCGISHFDPEVRPRATRWASVCSYSDHLHVLTRWDRSSKNYFSDTKKEAFGSLKKAKLAGEAWVNDSGVQITEETTKCPTCHRPVAK